MGVTNLQSQDTLYKKTEKKKLCIFHFVIMNKSL